uniref:Uncharacterized protein n=1 Tax=Romanomermis culicivorax TaxID=13658 RepID=A0A915K7Y5_ROMCU
MSSGGLFAQQQKQSLVSANQETQPIPAEKSALCNCKRPKAKVTCHKHYYFLIHVSDFFGEKTDCFSSASPKCWRH